MGEIGAGKANREPAEGPDLPIMTGKERKKKMKKILAMAAVAALAAGASACAANPFSDVSTSDWAYQAVADLSDQGIVEGYPDGTFRGETSITRYEMAQITARLMAKEDLYNRSQRAAIDKLAVEYAGELDSLGVRVSSLEKKVGNISWSGDARMQYQDHGDYGDDSWGARARIVLSGQVNDKVRVEGRLSAEADMKGNDAYIDSEDDGDVTMDRIHVVYEPTDRFAFDMGRTGVGLSQTGIFMDEDGYFDGVVADYGTESFFAKAGYGRFDGDGAADLDGSGHGFDLHDYEAWFLNVGGRVADRAELSAFYLTYSSRSGTASELDAMAPGLGDKYGDDITVWGVGAGIDVGGHFVIDGDYIRHADDVTDDAALWTAGLTYGEVDPETPGTFSLALHYADVDEGAYVGGSSAWDMTDQLEQSLLSGARFWAAKAGVAVMQNVELDAYYYFGGDAKASGADDPDDTFGVELNYFF